MKKYSKEEILHFMQENRYVAVSHWLFDDEEFLFMADDGKIYCEDGKLFEDGSPAHNGMQLRNEGAWKEGWCVLPDKNILTLMPPSRKPAAQTKPPKEVTFSFSLDASKLEHMKDVSSYNRNYYKIGFDWGSETLIPKRANVLLEEAIDDENEVYYTLGFFQENEFVSCWKWLEEKSLIH